MFSKFRKSVKKKDKSASDEAHRVTEEAYAQGQRMFEQDNTAASPGVSGSSQKSLKHDDKSDVITSSSRGKILTSPPKVRRDPVERDPPGDFTNEKPPTDESLVHNNMFVNDRTTYGDDAATKTGKGYFFDPSDTQGGYYEAGSGVDATHHDNESLPEATRARLNEDLHLKTVPSAYQHQKEQEEKEEQERLSKLDENSQSVRGQELSKHSTKNSSTLEKTSTKSIDPEEAHQLNKSTFNPGGITSVIRGSKPVTAHKPKEDKVPTDDKQDSSFDNVSPDLTNSDGEDNAYDDNKSSSYLKVRGSKESSAAHSQQEDDSSDSKKNAGIIAGVSATAAGVAATAKKMTGFGGDDKKEDASVKEAYTEGFKKGSYDAGKVAANETRALAFVKPDSLSASGSNKSIETKSVAFIKDDPTNEPRDNLSGPKTLDPKMNMDNSKAMDSKDNSNSDSNVGVFAGATGAVGAIGAIAASTLGLGKSNENETKIESPDDQLLINNTYEAGKNKAVKDFYQEKAQKDREIKQDSEPTVAIGAVTPASSDRITQSSQFSNPEPQNGDNIDGKHSALKHGNGLKSVGAGTAAAGLASKPFNKDNDLSDEDESFSKSHLNNTEDYYNAGYSKGSEKKLDDDQVTEYYKAGYIKGAQERLVNVGSPTTKDTHNSGESEIPNNSLVIEVVGVEDKRMAARLAKKASKELQAQGIDLSTGKLVVNAETKQVYKIDDPNGTVAPQSKGDHKTKMSIPEPSKSNQSSKANSSASAETEPVKSKESVTNGSNGKATNGHGSKSGALAAGVGSSIAAGTAFAGLHKSKEDKSKDLSNQDMNKLANLIPESNEISSSSRIPEDAESSKEPSEPTRSDSDIVVTVQGAKNDREASEVANSVVMSLKNKPHVLNTVKELRINASTGVVTDENGNIVSSGNFHKNEIPPNSDSKETKGSNGMGHFNPNYGASANETKPLAPEFDELDEDEYAEDDDGQAGETINQRSNTENLENLESLDPKDPKSPQVFEESQLDQTNTENGSSNGFANNITKTGAAAIAGAGGALGALGLGMADGLSGSARNNRGKFAPESNPTPANSVAYPPDSPEARSLQKMAALNQETESKLNDKLSTLNENRGFDDIPEEAAGARTTGANTNPGKVSLSYFGVSNTRNPSVSDGNAKQTTNSLNKPVTVNVVGCPDHIKSKIQKDKLDYITKNPEYVPANTKVITFDAKTGIAYDGIGKEISELSTLRSYSFDEKVNKQDEVIMPGTFFY